MTKTAQLFFTIAATILLAPNATAQTVIDRGAIRSEFSPITIQLDGIPTSALVVMLMRDVMKVPYVISPDVLADRRATSVKLVIPRDKVPERVVGYLRKSGFVVQLVGGTVYISKTPLGSSGTFIDTTVPSGSPLTPPPVGGYQSINAQPATGQQTQPTAAPEPLQSQNELAAYKPAHREPAFLAAILAPLFPMLTFGAREQSQADPANQNIAGSNGPDVLMMSGPRTDLKNVQTALAQLDTARAQVEVKAVVMQVSDVQNRASALSLLASVAGGKLEVGSFNTLGAASQYARLSVGALTAVFSAVKEDSRFQVIASPNLSALSGSVASINAGSQVPTIGAVTTNEGGSVQSVVYRDSGITLQVRPVVRGEIIELDVRQERSNFVRTTTGVEDSPTLQRATVTSQALLQSGESIVLAGLNENSSGNTREGIFGGLLGVRSREKSDSQLLLIIQAQLVPARPQTAGTFTWLTTGKDEDEHDKKSGGAGGTPAEATTSTASREG